MPVIREQYQFYDDIETGSKIEFINPILPEEEGICRFCDNKDKAFCTGHIISSNENSVIVKCTYKNSDDGRKKRFNKLINSGKSKQFELDKNKILFLIKNNHGE